MCQRQFVLARIPNFGHDTDILNELENVEVEKIYSIYRITNTVNQKVYIGFTEKNPDYRWRQHIRTMKYVDATQHQYLHKAMLKYGVEHFIFEVIYQSLDQHDTLSVMEPLFITAYRSFGVGVYNLSNGGESSMKGRKHSSTSRALIGAASRGNSYAKGHKHTDETKLICGDASRNRVITDDFRSKISKLKIGNKNFLGHRHTAETKLKMSLSQRGRPVSEEQRKKQRAAMVRYTYQVIHPCGKSETINSMKQFCKLHGLATASMSKVMNGTFKQHKGFRCTKLS